MELRTSSELSNRPFNSPARGTAQGQGTEQAGTAFPRPSSKAPRALGAPGRLLAAMVFGSILPSTALAQDAQNNCSATIQFIDYDGVSVPTTAPCDVVVAVGVAGNVVQWEGPQIVYEFGAGGEIRLGAKFQKIATFGGTTYWRGHADCLPGAEGFRAELVTMTCLNGFINNTRSRTIPLNCGGDPSKASFTDLSPGEASALSADGSVIGGSRHTSSYYYGPRHAALWTRQGGWRDLDPTGAFGDSGVAAVSSDGSVAVGNTDKQPFRWTQATGMQDLSAPSALFGWTKADGMSADASVVVGFGQIAVSPYTIHAIRWIGSGTAQDLGTMLGMNPANSIASAVSADGTTVVGYAYQAGYGDLNPGPNRAFRWTQAGGMQDLGLLPGGTYALATAVSSDGSVVAGYADVQTGSGHTYRAFRWTQAGGMQDLGTGGSCSMSADGSVIIVFDTINSYVWTPALGKCVPLKDFVAASGISNANLSGNVTVSADGTTLIGDYSDWMYLRSWTMNLMNPTWSAPTIAAQPAPTSTCASGTAQFSVSPSGAGLFNFQWQWKSTSGQWITMANGLNLDPGTGLPLFRASGSTGSLATIDPPTSGGVYPILYLPKPMAFRCIVKNSAGSTTTDEATLAVCFADHDCNTFVNGDDFDAFAIEYYYGAAAADIDGNGFVNGDDYDSFFAAFEAGC